MSHPFEPKLHPVRILSLRPTQITVGFHEVEMKRLEWRRKGYVRAEDYLGDHMVPVVLGPKGNRYIIDHHHLARALHEEGVEHILTNTLADFSTVEKPAFWRLLDHRNWVYPYDAKGERHEYGDIPKSIVDLVDDPYRSLAGALRHAGGFAKEAAPFSEFQWADFMRTRISRSSIADNFSGALAKALPLAHEQAAAYLPGWCGRSQ